MNDDILLSILLTIENDLSTNNKTKQSVITNINEYIAWLETGEKQFAKDYSKEKVILGGIRWNIVKNEILEAKENLKNYIKSLM